MSKRFTDSEKFNDLWYRKLKPKHKCLWEFMLSKCDICGILELDFESMNFHIGDKFTMNDLEDFENKIIFIATNKIFIPNFIKFQQNELNKNNPAHKNIIKRLENLGIDLSIDFKELKSSFEGASKPLKRDIGIGNSKGNSNSNSNSNIKGNGNSKNCAKENFDFIENEDWKNLFLEWLDYKAKNKDSLKPISYKPAYDKLVKLSGSDLVKAKEIVGNSIANGWKGLFELKRGYKPPEKKDTATKNKETLIREYQAMKEKEL